MGAVDEVSARSVHVWGFFDGNGRPLLPDGVAPSISSPFEHWERLVRHLAHFDTEITEVRTARTIGGGEFIAVSFETGEREGCAAMWHIVQRPAEPWPDFPSRWPTTETVDSMLAQLEVDRNSPYWQEQPHADSLAGAEVWLQSLRDHLTNAKP